MSRWNFPLQGFGKRSPGQRRAKNVRNEMCSVTVLEERILMTNGWTELQPSADSRLIYISSSAGDDANDGLSEATPKKTFSAAIGLMRNGFPDWLMLKRGDTWNDDLTWQNWKMSGRSAGEKQVITAYGEGERPIIKNGRFQSWAGETEPQLKHFAIVGIEFYASYNDPASSDYGKGTARLQALSILQRSADDILIEDNKFSFYDSNVYVSGGAAKNTNVTIRRNVIKDALRFGILSPNGDGTLIEENVMDKNGWEQRTNKLHSIYAKENFNLTIRKNILSRSGLFGVKASSDYLNGSRNILIEDNLFFKSTLGLAGFSKGATGYDPTVDYGTTNADILNNVFISPGKTLPYDSTSTYTGAGTTENINDLLMDGNIYTHNNEYQGIGTVMHVGGWKSKSSGIVIRNAIVHDWYSSHFTSTGSYIKVIGDVTDVTLENNYPAGVEYADPDRDMTTYSQSIGGAADPEAFLIRASQQSRANWDARFTADAFNEYIRDGFSVVLETPVFAIPNNTTTSDPLQTVSWNTIDGADAYEVWYSNLTTDQNPALTATVASASYTPATALPIGQYRIWVRATQDGGPASPWSTPITLRVNTAPTLNSLPTDGAEGKPQLTWTPVPGAVRYEVWGDNLTTGAKKVVNAENLTETSFTPDSDLGFSEFRFWVRGFDVKGVSSEWSFAQDYSRVGVRTAVQPVVFDGLNSLPPIAWNEVAGAARYELWANNLTTGENAIIRNAEIPGASFVPTEPLPVGTNRFWVRAFDAAGRATKWSDTLDAVNRPALLTPVAPTFERRPTFTWAALPGMNSSEVYISINGTVINPKGILGTSWTPASDLPVGVLRWWVRSSAANGTLGPWSARAESFIGGRSAVLAAGVPGNDSARLGVFAWQAVTGASRYILHVEHIGVGVVILERNLTGTSYTTSAPLAAGEYRAWVKAIDGSDNVTGIWSTMADFTVVSSSSETDPSAADLQLVLRQLPEYLEGHQRRALINESPHPLHPEEEEGMADVVENSSDPIKVTRSQCIIPDFDDWLHPSPGPNMWMSEQEANLIDQVMGESRKLMHVISAHT